MSTSTTDVVVTGLGATTPLGGDVASTWEALLAGRSGVSRITDDWIKDYPAAARRPPGRPTRPSRSTASAPAGSTAASRSRSSPPRRPGSDSGAGDAGVDPLRIAVVFGTGIGGALTLLGQDDVLEEKGPKRVSPFTIPMLMPNGPAAAVGLAVGAKGGVHAPVSACASGAEADPLGPGPAALRPRRRRPRRRHRGVRAPAADGRVRRHARHVAPATTSPSAPPGRSTRPATASCSARAPAALVLERGRRGEGPRRPHPRPAGRRRRHRRRLRPGRPAPRGRGRRARHHRGPARRRADPGRHRPRQRARHVDAGGRHRRGRRDPLARSASTCW